MKNKQNFAYGIFSTINYIILLSFTMLCVFPLYYIFINTISNNKLSTTGKVLFYPLGIHFDNYIQVFQLDGLGQAALISIARTGIGTLFTLLGTAFLGYALSKKEMWKRQIWYRLVVISMYFNAGIIPWFVTMKMLGLRNNFMAYILPMVVMPFFLILFKTFVEQLPESLEESAQIDGAGYLVRFFRILLPICTPILATIAIFSCVNQWNSFQDTLFLMSDSKLYTLQFLLYQFLGEANTIVQQLQQSGSSGLMDVSNLLTPTSVRMTITIIVTLPILFVYPFFQRFYVKGIMLGAVKG